MSKELDRSDGHAHLLGRRRQHRPSMTARTAANQAAILGAAAELFAARPYDEVSIDDIAAKAAVAHGLIYYYYKDKRGLFTTVVRQLSEQFLDTLRPSPAESDPEERLRGVLSRHFAYGREHPDRFRLLMPGAHPDGSLQAGLEAAREAVLHESLGCPPSPPPLLRAAIQGWTAFLDKVTRLWLDDAALELDDVVELCIQTLAGSVQASSGARYELAETLQLVVDIPRALERGAA